MKNRNGRKHGKGTIQRTEECDCERIREKITEVSRLSGRRDILAFNKR